MKKIFIYCILMLTAITNTHAQQVNVLNQYGIGPVFLGGLFREGIPVGQLQSRGSFGIAAPAMVDGELIEYNGRIYQTRSNGETKPSPDTLLVPFGMFCFFKPDTTFQVSKTSPQQEVEQIVNSVLKNKNGIYAIRITGTFANIKTRAFHRVAQEPFPPITEIQAAQQVFNYHDLNGTMFGYRMPAHMGGISGTGFHFHFLSEDKQKGGHILSYSSQTNRVEIALIRQVSLEIPNDPAFSAYQTSTIK